MSVDVVQGLAKFRKERKKAFEEAVGRGDGGGVEGYWLGEMKVVWDSSGEEGVRVDCYGNYFEKSGVYW